MFPKFTPLFQQILQLSMPMCIGQTFSVIYVANTNIKVRCIHFYHISCQYEITHFKCSTRVEMEDGGSNQNESWPHGKSKDNIEILKSDLTNRMDCERLD